MNLMFNTVVNIKVCLLKYHLEPHLFKLYPRKQEYLPPLNPPKELFQKSDILLEDLEYEIFQIA